MTSTQTPENILRELENARTALKVGNDGMARVCARRAAGRAIGLWLEHIPHHGWASDAMNRLNHLKSEPSLPEHVRQAAVRLTAKVTAQFTSPFPTNPVDDAEIIIAYLLKGTQE
jgi:hypothetical protein